ncbi:alpha/beta fold hydrolase [Oceaniglobus roseus]|uniref:alpha/beta fold hydrolase n=1 Tax=Oceaniglobus roseus TaxID=1737570 RepID=UPI000C7EE877|nr:alpha/beta hydrolase [Kandeliimicrobium roseum]
METAPFHACVADAPDGTRCFWVRAADGVRLRAAAWGEGERGTVLLFTGRTEYVEKYGRAARDFARRGFATITIDWRGQGLSDRLTANPLSGHVDRFPDYQRDVAALVEAARQQDMPRPYYLVAHSMGGAIGLRALYEGLDVKAAAFSAPMWGILLAPALRPLAWSVSWASRGLGFDTAFAPGTSSEGYVSATGFQDNLLTTDIAMWDYMQAQIRECPDLVLGGPSLQWLYEALSETRALAARPAPAVPTLCALGELERIVDRARIERRMKGWRDGTLDIIPGARHEVMMEVPHVRDHFFDAAAELFSAHR